ncbi:DUF397 domain-containing protein [Catenuloplanes nepalensis]|uniref:DUF397 domain-containing protein n=1 Tax=Catenuloplanes nepalensis TaxID=587533 RepID=UPI0027D906C7|nr:DUF397 domain-containing protein [Catenuloplanes nepalensis]
MDNGRGRVGWRKSSYSSTLNCVEFLGPLSGDVTVRDSKSRSGARLQFSRPAWAAFIASLSDGRTGFDQAPSAS